MLAAENSFNITMAFCLFSDNKLTIILGVVIPVVGLAVIIAGVVAWHMWKKKDKG